MRNAFGAVKNKRIEGMAVKNKVRKPTKAELVALAEIDRKARRYSKLSDGAVRAGQGTRGKEYQIRATALFWAYTTMCAAIMEPE